MQQVLITKIEILTNRTDGHPIYYCHSEDRDHSPSLTVNQRDNAVAILAHQILYKVKANPQTKNRVDIYMSITQARLLGSALLLEAGVNTPYEWRESRANPAAAAKGNMRLPNIHWSRYGRYVSAKVYVRSGTMSDASGGYINVDLESPVGTHIKMKEHEIHIGVQLNAPTGTYDQNETVPVHVPESEFQRSKNETNPLLKVRGDFSFEVTRPVAAGLGRLLSNVKVPQ